MRAKEFVDEAGGVGKIVKNVNTTADVKPGEIQRQAAKFGFELDDSGEPPLIYGKKKKKSKT